MKKFWVLWTYSANYSELKEVDAFDPDHALNLTTGFFSKDFHKKATVYVFDRPPVFTKAPA
jgi:hypothetical protein